MHRSMATLLGIAILAFGRTQSATAGSAFREELGPSCLVAGRETASSPRAIWFAQATGSAATHGAPAGKKNNAWSRLKNNVYGFVRFMGKLSGPGPFLGAGIAVCPYSTEFVTDSRGETFPSGFAVKLGASYSQSLENDLHYRSSPFSSFEIPSEAEKRVHEVAIAGGVEFFPPRWPVFFGLSSKADIFSGDLFKTFTVPTVSPELGYRPWPGILISAVANFYPQGFEASDFGAATGLEGGDETVLEATVQVSLGIF